MPPERFAAIGRLLHGPHWHRELARGLKVERRNVMRWELGTAPIPAGVAGDLAALCDEKAQTLLLEAADLRGRQPPTRCAACGNPSPGPDHRYRCPARV